MLKLSVISKSFGFIQLPLLIGLLVVSIALPVASKLVSQNQENRSQATSCDACNGLPPGAYESCRLYCTNPPPVCNCNCAVDKYTDQNCMGSCGQLCRGQLVRPVLKSCSYKRWNGCDGTTRKCETTTTQVAQSIPCPPDQCGSNQGNSPDCGYRDCNCNCAVDKYTDQNCMGSCGQLCKGQLVRPTPIPSPIPQGADGTACGGVNPPCSLCLHGFYGTTGNQKCGPAPTIPIANCDGASLYTTSCLNGSYHQCLGSGWTEWISCPSGLCNSAGNGCAPIPCTINISCGADYYVGTFCTDSCGNQIPGRKPLASPTPIPGYTCISPNQCFGATCSQLGKQTGSGTCPSGQYCCGNNIPLTATPTPIPKQPDGTACGGIYPACNCLSGVTHVVEGVTLCGAENKITHCWSFIEPQPIGYMDCGIDGASYMNYCDQNGEWKTIDCAAGTVCDKLQGRCIAKTSPERCLEDMSPCSGLSCDKCCTKNSFLDSGSPTGKFCGWERPRPIGCPAGEGGTYAYGSTRCIAEDEVQSCGQDGWINQKCATGMKCTTNKCEVPPSKKSVEITNDVLATVANVRLFDQASNYYSPAMNTMVGVVNGKVYDYVHGYYLGTVEQLKDTVILTGNKVGRRVQVNYVTPNSFNDPYILDIFNKISPYNTYNLPKMDKTISLSYIEDQSAYKMNDFVTYNPLINSVDNNYYQLKSSVGITEKLFFSDILGVINNFHVGFSYLGDLLGNRNIEELVKNDKAICYEFSVLEQMYLATQNKLSYVTASGTLSHAFLLINDNNGQVQVVDPTRGVKMSLIDHQRLQDYRDPIILDHIYSTLGIASSLVVDPIEKIKTEVYCTSNTNEFYCKTRGCVWKECGFNNQGGCYGPGVSDLQACPQLTQCSSYGASNCMQSGHNCNWYSCAAGGAGGCFNAGVYVNQACPPVVPVVCNSIGSESSCRNQGGQCSWYSCYNGGKGGCFDNGMNKEYVCPNLVKDCSALLTSQDCDRIGYECSWYACANDKKGACYKKGTDQEMVCPVTLGKTYVCESLTTYNQCNSSEGLCNWFSCANDGKGACFSPVTSQDEACPKPINCGDYTNIVSCGNYVGQCDWYSCANNNKGACYKKGTDWEMVCPKPQSKIYNCATMSTIVQCKATEGQCAWYSCANGGKGQCLQTGTSQEIACPVSISDNCESYSDSYNCVRYGKCAWYSCANGGRGACHTWGISESIVCPTPTPKSICSGSDRGCVIWGCEWYDCNGDGQGECFSPATTKEVACPSNINTNYNCESYISPSSCPEGVCVWNVTDGKCVHAIEAG